MFGSDIIVESGADAQAKNGVLNGNAGVFSNRPKNDLDLVKKTPTQWMMGSKFDTQAKHHESIKALWEVKWKPTVSNVHRDFGHIKVYQCNSHKAGSAKGVFIHFTIASLKTSRGFLTILSR